MTTARVHVEVGQPIDISEFYGRDHEKEVLEDSTRRFLAEIARLAGVKNFKPQLAGRFYKPGANQENAAVGAMAQ